MTYRAKNVFVNTFWEKRYPAMKKKCISKIYDTVPNKTCYSIKRLNKQIQTDDLENWMFIQKSEKTMAFYFSLLGDF